MRICGVDIKGRGAILAIVSSDDENNLTHVDSTSRKLELPDDRDSEQLKVMHRTIKAFAIEHQIDRFVIKSRKGTGPMASGGITFKIEGLFQLSDTPVDFVSPQALGQLSKKNAGSPPASVKQYQKDAYLAAVLHLVQL